MASGVLAQLRNLPMFQNYVPNEAYAKMGTYYYFKTRPATPWKLACEKEHPRDKTYADIVAASLASNEGLTHVFGLSICMVVFMFISTFAVCICKGLFNKTSVFGLLVFVQIACMVALTYGAYISSLTIDEGHDVLLDNLKVYSVVNECSDVFTKINTQGARTNLEASEENIAYVEHMVYSMAGVLLSWALVACVMVVRDRKQEAAMRDFRQFDD
jgi:heme A synthase